MIKDKYTFEDFKNIIETLRSEGGCPWDREQTHESLRSCMMEEAAELVASIRIYGQTGNFENMREELGDILLQVVMHSQIAKEEGLFQIEDVIDEISRKMIRRHPHVFGDVIAKDASEVLDNWDEIKKKEKEGKDWIESPLREIPRELPALTRAPKVLKKVDKLYEKGKNYEQTVEELKKNVDKLEKIDIKSGKGELIGQIGEILVNISNISRIQKLSQEQILTDEIDSLIEKFEP